MTNETFDSEPLIRFVHENTPASTADAVRFGYIGLSESIECCPSSTNSNDKKQDLVISVVN